MSSGQTDPAPAFCAAHVRALKWTLLFHADLAKGGTVWSYAAIDFPELVVTRERETRRAPEVKTCRVGDLVVPWGDWDLAADLIHFRRGRPDDADEPFFEEGNCG